MKSQIELSVVIRKAMKRKRLDADGLAKTLGMNRLMVDKLVSGEIVPSTHLEKQMVEVLGIPQHRAEKVAAQRRQKTNSRQSREAVTRKAA